MEFENAVEIARNAQKILNVSHYDADGLCCAKILKTALEKEGKEVKTKIVNELSEDVIEEIKKDNHDLIIFSDLGSGYLSMLPKDRKIIILDHHVPEKTEVPDNILQLNPCLKGKELCGAGICFLFSLHLNKSIELVDYAIIGAIGDHQIETGKNLEIMEFAEKTGRLRVEKGLKIFGHINRPIHESLCKADFFPMEDHSEVIQFLSDLKIDLRCDGRIKSFCDLTKEEREKLCSEIIKERLRNNFENPGDIFSDIYVLTKQPKELMDALEDSTIFNAFGRLGRYDEIFEVTEGNLEKLNEVMAEYRKRLSTYLSWAAKNRNKFPETGNVLFINAGDKIDENMIGTITSIMSNCPDKKKVYVGLAEGKEGIKISARSKIEGLDLNEIMKGVCGKMNCIGGGHSAAAGGKIDIGKDKEFIELFGEEVDKQIRF